MIVLDHSLTVQLWEDPWFWELLPWLSPIRESAEELVEKAIAEQTSFSLQHNSLYTWWLRELRERNRVAPESLQPLWEYIRKRRNRPTEAIKLPAA